MKTSFFRYVMYYFFPSVIAFSAHAEQIKVVTEYLTPYQINNIDNALGGFSTEIVRAIFKEAKREPKFIVLPWPRAYEVAKAEKNVLIFSLARTKDREKLFQWIGSLTNEKLYFWGLKKQFQKPVNDIELLKHYKIAIARYSNVDQYLFKHNFKRLYKLSKEEQNIKMLFKGRADLIVSTELTLKYKAKKLGFDFKEMIKVKEFTDLSNDLSLAINLKSDTNLVREFQLAYEVIKAQGIIDTIYNKWSILPHKD